MSMQARYVSTARPRRKGKKITAHDVSKLIVAVVAIRQVMRARKYGYSAEDYAKALRAAKKIPLNRYKDVRKGLVDVCSTCKAIVYPENLFCTGCGKRIRYQPIYRRK